MCFVRFKALFLAVAKVQRLSRTHSSTRHEMKLKKPTPLFALLIGYAKVNVLSFNVKSTCYSSARNGTITSMEASYLRAITSIRKEIDDILLRPITCDHEMK